METDELDPTLNPAEDPALDSSLSEETTDVTETEPDAGDTGDNQSTDTGQDEFGPVPYTRFKERNDRANELEKTNKLYEQLFQDPQALQAYIARQTTGQPPEKPATDTLIKLPEDFDPEYLTDNETVLFNIAKQLEQRLIQTETKADTAITGEQQRAVKQAGEQFEATIASCEKEVGRTFTDTEKEEIYNYAVYVQDGAMARNTPISTPDAVKAGFSICREKIVANPDKAKATRDAQLAKEKARLAQSRSGNVPGPQVAQNPGKMTPQEAGEKAFREAYPNGL